MYIPDNSASKSSTMSLQSKCWLRFNHKSWSSTFAINQDLLHSVFLHLEFSQGWKFTQPAKRQDKFIPIGILLSDLLTDGKESIASNLQGLVTINKGNNLKKIFFCRINKKIREIALIFYLWSPVNQACWRHSCAFILFSFCLINNFRIKSLPSSLTFIKASSSKTQLQALTFFNVSKSVDPANGDNPDSKT